MEPLTSTLNRRGFLIGIIAAPAIVKISNIMPVRLVDWPPRMMYVDPFIMHPGRPDGSLANPWATLQQAMEFIQNDKNFHTTVVHVPTSQELIPVQGGWAWSLMRAR